MHPERMSGRPGCRHKWTRPHNIAALPRNVGAWPNWSRASATAGSCTRWRWRGQSSRTRPSPRDFNLRPDGIRLSRRPASCRPSETTPAPSAAGSRAHADRERRSPFPNTLERSAGTRLTSPPDGIPSSSKPLTATRKRRRCSPPTPHADAAAAVVPKREPIAPVWNADSAFVPALDRALAAGYLMACCTGVTLLKHLEKLPKRESRRRLRPAFGGT
jgi:hypothetical protein